MLTVNCFDITAVDSTYYRLFKNAASAERRGRADRYHFIDDSKRCICAELLLKYSLFQATGQSLKTEIVCNEYGKPFIAGVSDFSYSISHSGKWVGIAYGSYEAGLDIEEIQEYKPGIAKRYFTEEENSFIHAVPEEQAERFMQIWTQKESYVKYLGTGFSIRPDSFSINAINGTVMNDKGEVQKEIKLKSCLFDQNYFLAACSTEDKMTIHKIRIGELIKFTDL